VYNNIVLTNVATISRYATKQAEDKKFLDDRTSRQPIAIPHGGLHFMVPFAIE